MEINVILKFILESVTKYQVIRLLLTSFQFLQIITLWFFNFSIGLAFWAKI